MAVCIWVRGHELFIVLRETESSNGRVYICKHVSLSIMRFHMHIGKYSQHTLAWLRPPDVET